MHVRVVLLALLTVAVGACATPQDGTRQAAAAPATTTAARAAAPQRQAKAPPPGIVPAARRRPAPDLRVTAFDGRQVTLNGFRGSRWW
jgi:hypothetical protein